MTLLGSSHGCTLLLAVLLAITVPRSACPDLGGPSVFWNAPGTGTTFPETSAPEGPLPFQKEAVQRTVFDNCFLAGTNVETASRGGVAVEDVRVGDRIAPPPGHSCEDPRCGEVVRLFRNQTDQIVTITAVARPRAREHRASGSGVESGDGEDAEPPSASQTIRCTPGHPFFVEGRGWVLAGDLRAGDELDARGERVVVAAVEVRGERAETFNFEVRCHHTYRVSGAAGQPAVLVHNTSMARFLARGRRITRSVSGAIREAGGIKGIPGAFWNRVGSRTESMADAMIRDAGGSILRRNVGITGTRRSFDRLLSLAGESVNLEIKYSIRSGTKGFERLARQIEGMVATGRRSAVWSLQAPTGSTMKALRGRLGSEVFDQIEFSHGARGLQRWLGGG